MPAPFFQIREERHERGVAPTRRMVLGNPLDRVRVDPQKRQRQDRVPQDDLISKLIRGDADGDKLSQEELSSFFILLLLAGSDTTRTAISHGMKALCDHPDERRKWAADFC